MIDINSWVLIRSVSQGISIYNGLLLFGLACIVGVNIRKLSPGNIIATIGLLSGGFFFGMHSFILIEGPFWKLRELNEIWFLFLGLLVVQPLLWFFLVHWFLPKSGSVLKRAGLVLLFTYAVVLLLTVTSYSLKTFITRFIWHPWPLAFGIFVTAASITPVLFVSRALKQEPVFYLSLRSIRLAAWALAGILITLFFTMTAVFLSGRFPLETVETFWALEAGNAVIVFQILVAILAIGRAVLYHEALSGHYWPTAGLAGAYRSFIFVLTGVSVCLWYLLIKDPAAYGVAGVAVCILIFGFFWQNRQNNSALARQSDTLGRLDGVRFFKQDLFSLESPGAGDSSHPDVNEEMFTNFTALCRDYLECRYARLVPGNRWSIYFQKHYDHPEGPAELTGEWQTTITDYQAKFAGEEQPFLFIGKLNVYLIKLSGDYGYFILGPHRRRRIYTYDMLLTSRRYASRICDFLIWGRISELLLKLEKQRLEESNLQDFSGRRYLHDEVLPEIHSLILESAGLAPAELADRLTKLHKQVADLLRELNLQSGPRNRDIKDWQLWLGKNNPGLTIKVAGSLSLADWSDRNTTIFFNAVRELVRNSFRHGKNESLTVELELIHESGYTKAVITDNGRAEGPIKAGTGLTLHSGLVTLIGGELTVEATEAGTVSQVILPDGDT